MTEGCPHLDYRQDDGERHFDVARAYCTVADRFVQPMRADICTARYDLSPAEHCEIYREHGGIEDDYLLDDGENANGGENEDEG